MTDASGPFFPPSTRIIGADSPSKCVLTVQGESGSGKSHLGYQLLNDSEYGPGEVLFLKREEASTIYGTGAHVVDVDTFADVEKQLTILFEAVAKGAKLPRLLFIDSWSGLAHGTQAYYREHPIEEWSEKRGEFTRNKYAEFGELGTQNIDRLLKAHKLPMDVVVLMTTWRPPGGVPEFAVEGKMIPKHLSQLSTCALYLMVETSSVGREMAIKEDAGGRLRKPHRIIEPWKETDDVVPVIGRFLYSQGSGEVICKGHRNLKVKEPAYLPRVLRKIHGRPEPKDSPYYEGERK